MINLSKITDYLLVYLLIAFSGVPFFYRANMLMMLGFLVFPLVVFVVRKRKIDRFIVYYILIALVVQIGQMLKFYDLPIATFLGLHIRLLFAYLTIRAVGNKTIGYYTNILCFSVITSLLFYLPSYASGFEPLLKSAVVPFFDNPFIKESNYVYHPNVILYTINTKGEGLSWLKRNSGPFWEPGAFSGFLILALIFQIIQTGTINNTKSKILILGVVSTFSTSGLMVLVILLLFYFLLNKKLGYRYFVMPLLAIGGVVLFFSVDFIGAKVISKINFTHSTYNTRFKSAWLDINDFIKNPVLGLGRSEKSRFQAETRGRLIHRNNGVTNHLAMYGGIVFLIYFYLIYLAFYRMCIAHDVDKRMAFFALVIIMLIGFSQVYFTRVFFIALSMMPVLFNGKKRIIKSTGSFNPDYVLEHRYEE
ncbi:hypothetical protein E9993_08810 [Labilibacter sediminis]|nr:hypothetical protein E9993_08810 [Labilibacter sediminis]